MIEPGSCFAGTLLELALAADRSYMLDCRGERAARRSRCRALNFGAYPMVNGLSRLADALLRRCRPTHADARQAAATPTQRCELGLVTSTPDDIDWDDEIRIAIEERASLSPDALTGMEANLRFAGAGDHGDAHLRPAVRVAELDLHPAERGRREGRAQGVRHRRAKPKFDWERVRLEPAHRNERASTTREKIPNNVNLGERPHAAARARALAAELPRLVARDGAERLRGAPTSTCAPRSGSTRRAGRTSAT